MGDRNQEAKELINAIHALPIEHDENGRAFKRIPCRSMNDLGAWVGLVHARLENAEPPLNPKGYHPWISEGISEMQYRRNKYIESQKEVKLLEDRIVLLESQVAHLQLSSEFCESKAVEWETKYKELSKNFQDFMSDKDDGPFT